MVIQNCLSFRLLLDAISIPLYELAKLLPLILPPSTTYEFTAKNSFAFANEITNTDSNYVIASLDVESLFHISLKKLLKILCERFAFKKVKS